MTWFERNRRKTILFIVLAGIAGTDVIAGVGYRVIAGYPWCNRGIEWYLRSERSYRTQVDPYHHGLAANRSVETTFGYKRYKVRTNSLGFRDRCVKDVPLVSSRYRLVFMGDSFTEGLGVDYESTFVGLVDAALSTKGIEVLNAGVMGYCPVIYWRKTKYLLEEKGLKFNEMAVFIDISDVQQEADEPEAFYADEKGIVHARPDVAGDDTLGVWEWLRLTVKRNTVITGTIIQRREDQSRRRYDLNDYLARWTFDKGIYEKYARAGLERAEQDMDKLHSVLQEHSIALTVAVYPWPDQIMVGNADCLQVTFWRDWCKRHRVRFLTFFPQFLTGHTEEEKVKVIERCYLRGDMHWNENGHRLIADSFLASWGGRDRSANP